MNKIKYLLLPLLMAIYPSLFHYANNAAITVLPSLLRMLLLNVLIAILILIIYLMINRGNVLRSAIASFIFLLFFNTYGMFYDILLKQDFVRIEHYTLLPLFILIASYSSWLILKTGRLTLSRIWDVTLFILAALVFVNLVKILPIELEKWKDITKVPRLPVITVKENIPVNQKYPDIYYIVLDEFSGLEPMREYWHYQGVNDFKQFLEDKHFFVAEQSHGESEETLHELATRLNYQEYPPCCKDPRIFFNAIANNRVMETLKTEGYTTVTFDEDASVFPTDLPMKTDYLYIEAPEDFGSSAIFDSFSMLVIDNTMLRVFSSFYEPLISIPPLKAHIDMLSFTQDKVKNLGNISSPKFVYIHVLLPHMPFIYDKNGFVISSTYNTNWDDYLGNYIYAISYSEKMITDILLKADSENPPIIILQSDHGARNQIYNGNEDHLLINFPGEFKTSILFALYIPGLNMSSFPQDINPINTFPVIFNYLFNTEIPLK